ncbi:DNA translocase FtsK [Desulfovibrio sp. ZJ746]|uniref:DNA translocase FtsK n=1 Tax=Desulfovibrio sp. ZJ746 TaxID=2709795 RepID=UPI001F152689|nr:DNA translocase FtsK [Desulfovibrio sp. ZJ746]
MPLEEKPTDIRKFLRELFGLFLLFWALLLLLSLLSFDAGDPSFNHVVSSQGPVHNKAGLFGAYAAGFLNDIFGVAAFLWPLVFGALGAAYVSSGYALHWWRWCGFFLLTLCLLVAGSWWDLSAGDLAGGGMVGSALYDNARHYLSPVGSTMLWVFVLLVGLQLACNFSWFSLAARLKAWAAALLEERKERKLAEAAEAAPEYLIPGEDGGGDKTGGAPWWKRLAARLPLPDTKALKERFGRCRDVLGSIRPTAGKMPELDFPEAEGTPEKGEGADGQSASEVSGAPEEDLQPAAQAPAQPSAPEAPAHAPAAARAPHDAPRAAEPPKGRRAKIPLPGLDLLTPPAPGGARAREDHEARGAALMGCLKDFDIQGDLVRVTPGPVVTMYEVRPAPGIRVNRIANLSDDLSRALMAPAVRIQAPIPGSDTVGIEIPNEQRETVNFRELAASEPFRRGCGPLTMILGKDIAGRPAMADLTRMPHLLVAGATGAGKSVCLNSILVSLLYRTQPQDLRLLLIDPKRIEMAVYADEPHLVHPVVTEMADAKNALEWAVHEMDNRYRSMARLGVRNVAAYNQKLAAFRNDLPPDLADLERLPYLVIVIDELADLMMTAAREVETSVVRLAQLARAAGIHMILATQRPSVDVVTGLIKANFPCRISFQVTSRHDSRTILDQMGAEQLLGRGDMLFKPSGGRLQRLHGPFLADEEVQAVVNHWKRQLAPTYEVDFSQWSAAAAAGPGGGGDASQDPLYEEARAFVLESGRSSISTSLLQRRLQVGYNRATRLMDQFEAEGLVGPANGSKPRPIIRG